MLRSSLARLSIALTLAAVSLPSLHAETLTYGDLVLRYTDMPHLAVLPPDGEAGGLASSYDRSSQYDAAKDQYIKWDANADGAGFVSDEGTTQVLADIKGAGCIWRIWSAAPGQGHVKIYLDGSTTPVIDTPFEDWFDHRKFFGVWSNLTYMHAGEITEGPGNNYDPGGNIYIPIPFSKSCRIVGDKGTGKDDNSKWGQYFHFSYTLFAPGTTVPDFQFPLTDEETKALNGLNLALGASQRGANPTPRPGEKPQTASITVAPGQTVSAFSMHGPGAITYLKIRTPLPEYAEPQRDFLRKLTIRITWDDQKTPAIWSPLGDFFGYIGGSGAFRTLPVGLLDDGTFYSHWYMPFASGAKIELGNDTNAPVTFSIEAGIAPLEMPIEKLARFHAKWHRDANLIARKDRFPDWPMVLTQGRGRFVGTMLHVWNPNGGWWGEGDEKFFVDGEKFPSFFGTGSEDYFGYAWGGSGRWERAFHAQILNENNNGHVDDQRWLIGDNVPFHTSFEGDIEKYFPNTLPDPASHPFDPIALFATEAYWYLSPDGTDSYGEVPPDQRVGYWTSNASYREPGAIEAESMELAKWTQNQIRNEGMWGAWPGALKGTKEGLWSNNRQLAWDPLNLDDRLDLKLPVAKAGKYQIIVRPTKGPGYGIFQFGVDGQNLGGVIDLYNKDIIPGDLVTLGMLDLTAGDHVLNITPTGKNPSVGGDANQKAATFALDYVKLVPVP
jgi:hypothetical protein